MPNHIHRFQMLEEGKVIGADALSYDWFNLYQTWMNDASCDVDALDRLRNLSLRFLMLEKVKVFEVCNIPR